MVLSAVTLRNAALEAVVLPDSGGGLARLDFVASGEKTPLLRPLAEPSARRPDPGELACFVLMPWSNRIGGGRFEFHAKTYRIAPNRLGEPYPIHGDGWQSAWQITAQSMDALTLRLDKTTSGPFRYRGELSYRLQEHALSVELSAENTGDETLPFGLGLHPYFERTPGVKLLAPATGMWAAGEDLLPVAHIPLPADADFNQPRELPAQLVDNAFSGWNGQAMIAWDEKRPALRIATTPQLAYFVLFCPPGRSFFCFEPVTHPINAFNLTQPFRQAGLVTLAPGERTSLVVTFTAIVD